MEVLRRLHDKRVKFMIIPKGVAPSNVTLEGYSLTRVCTDNFVEVYELKFAGG